MPASKVDSQSYGNEPPPISKVAPALKGTAEKEASPLSASASQWASLRSSSPAATSAAQAKASALGRVPGRFEKPGRH